MEKISDALSQTGTLFKSGMGKDDLILLAHNTLGSPLELPIGYETSAPAPAVCAVLTRHKPPECKCSKSVSPPRRGRKTINNPASVVSASPSSDSQLAIKTVLAFTKAVKSFDSRLLMLNSQGMLADPEQQASTSAVMTLAPPPSNPPFLLGASAASTSSNATLASTSSTATLASTSSYCNTGFNLLLLHPLQCCLHLLEMLLPFQLVPPLCRASCSPRLCLHLLSGEEFGGSRRSNHFSSVKIQNYTR